MSDEVCYWRCRGDGDIYATRGPSAVNGLFEWQDSEQRWIHINRAGHRWGFLHQMIFFANRCHRVSEDEIGQAFPALPELPPEPEPLSEMEVKRLASEFPANEFPKVAAWLESEEQPEVSLFVVLQEDEYETLLGDGCFRYPIALACTEETAEALRKNPPKTRCLQKVTRCYRRVKLALGDGVILVPEMEQKVFDEHTAFGVVDDLEKLLAESATQDLR